METAACHRRAPGRPAAHPPPAAGAGPKTPCWLWVGVALIVLFCLFPFYWLVNMSLKTGPDLSAADLIPPSPSLDNYQSIFQNDDFMHALRNTAIVASVTIVCAGLRARSRVRARAPALPRQVLDARAHPLDDHVPGDRDRGAALQALDATSASTTRWPA